MKSLLKSGSRCLPGKWRSAFVRFKTPWLLCGLMCSSSLVGCATTGVPTEGGLLDTVTALNGGAYEERLQQQRAVLNELKRAHGSKQQDLVELKQRKAVYQRDVELLKQSLFQEKQLGQSYKVRIGSLRERKQALATKIQSTKKAAVRTEKTMLQRAEEERLQSQRIADLQRKRDELRKQLDALIKIN